MTRTIVTLPTEMKTWLDSYSKKSNRSTAETIREAIRVYKENIEKQKKDPIMETSGMWKLRGVDAQQYTDELRDEWE